VIMASIMGRRDVKSSRGILIHADSLADNVDYDEAKMLVLPGGRLGTENLSKSKIIKEQCSAFAKDKYLAAVCAAPTIFASLGLLKNKRATVHPDFEGKMDRVIVTRDSVTVDDNIITGQGLGATIPFALKIIETLVNRTTAEKIANDICFHYRF